MAATWARRSRRMAERIDMQDLRFLAVAVTIQQQSGGNLAEILDGLAKVIRARFRLFRRVKAITAEAKWSGNFLSGFPLARAGRHQRGRAELLRRGEGDVGLRPGLPRRRRLPGRERLRHAQRS